MKQLLVLLCMFQLQTMTKADFSFRLQIFTHSTTGSCGTGDSCDTFFSVFCLRGQRGDQNQSTSTSDCPLGRNDQGLQDLEGIRTITSDRPWQGGFQMLIQALDDDTFFDDHLDYIFIDRELAANASPTPVTTYSGDRVTILINFWVQCLDDFYGPACTVFCEPQDNDVDGHFTCNETGSRVCLPGYFGEDCLVFCQASSNAEDGFYTCSQDGERICNPGFTDPEDFCREKDDCAVDPCQNDGNCTDLIGDFSCDCLPGYTGKNCSEDIEECLAAICPGNSTCVEDALDSYVCLCDSGFEGENCTAIQRCDSVVCENGGICVSEDPFCLCTAGYTGSTCEINIDDCLEAECPEGSLCVDGIDGFQCTSLQKETRSRTNALIIGCAVGGLVVIASLILIIILIVVITTKKSHYKAERSTSHIYHPSPTPFKEESISSTSAPTNNGASQDDTLLESNPLYGDTTLLSPSSFSGHGLSPAHTFENNLYAVVDSTQNETKEVIYEQPRNQDEGSKDNARFTITSNVSYLSTQNGSHDAINNPLYGTGTPLSDDSTEPPTYSVPRPTSPGGRKKLADEHAISSEPLSSSADNTSAAVSSPNESQYYESIRLLNREPLPEATASLELLPRGDGSLLGSPSPSDQQLAGVRDEDVTASSSGHYEKLQHVPEEEGKQVRLAMESTNYGTLETKT